MAKKRTDAERRLRQCERMSRLLRVLRLLLGPGRWDAEALAKELECSQRTIHRHLQTLSMAGVPWYYDNVRQAYRIRPGFKLAGLDPITDSDTASIEQSNVNHLRSVAQQVLSDCERLLMSLRTICKSLEDLQLSPNDKAVELHKDQSQ